METLLEKITTDDLEDLSLEELLFLFKSDEPVFRDAYLKLEAEASNYWPEDCPPFYEEVVYRPKDVSPQILGLLSMDKVGDRPLEIDACDYIAYAQPMLLDRARRASLMAEPELGGLSYRVATGAVFVMEDTEYAEQSTDGSRKFILLSGSNEKLKKSEPDGIEPDVGIMKWGMDRHGDWRTQWNAMEENVTKKLAMIELERINKIRREIGLVSIEIDSPAFQAVRQNKPNFVCHKTCAEKHTVVEGVRMMQDNPKLVPAGLFIAAPMPFEIQGHLVDSRTPHPCDYCRSSLDYLVNQGLLPKSMPIHTGVTYNTGANSQGIQFEPRMGADKAVEINSVAGFLEWHRTLTQPPTPWNPKLLRLARYYTQLGQIDFEPI